MSEENEMLSARVPKELKDLVDADSRSNQEVVRAALWREFGGERLGDIERRIAEKEKRMSMISDEVKERESQIAEIRKELRALQSKKKEKKDQKQSKIEQAKEALEDTPKSVDNPAIQHWADKLDLTPAELIEKLGDDA